MWLRRGPRRRGSGGGWAAAVAVLVGVVAPASIGAGGASAATSAAGTSALSVALVPLDHTSRAAVRDSYTGVLVPALQTPIGWTGNVDACAAGAPSAAAQNATLVAINWYRNMAGLPPVRFEDGRSAKAQEGALMLAANRTISHLPGPDWLCYTTPGAEALANSNVAVGAAGAKAISGFMVDAGTGLEAAGHRRWLLYPPSTTMGSGITSISTAIWVLDTFGPRPVSAPEWSPWPTAGYFPSALEPAGRWSLSHADADFGNATVSVQRGGTTLPVTKQAVTINTGDNTLVWQLDPGFRVGGPDQDYLVSVSGVLIGRDPTPVSFRYTVKLFDVNVDKPSAPGKPVGAPGLSSATVSWTAPASIGASAITKYTVTSSPSGKTCTWTSGPLRCKVDGLTDGSAETFTVRAENAQAAGPPSVASDPVTPGESCGPGGAGPFTDVAAGQAFCVEIQWLAKQGISTGYADGSFQPSAAVNRQSMAAFLYRLAGKPAFTPPAVASFKDVPLTHPFFKEIEWLASRKITTGYPDGSFGPNLDVTRLSMAAFLYRFDASPPFVPPAVATFLDVPTTQTFFLETEWLSAAKVTAGYPDKTYHPSEAVSRQAMAAFLFRLPAPA